MKTLPKILRGHRLVIAFAMKSAGAMPRSNGFASLRRGRKGKAI
jgi:hypothetical protein